MGMIEMETEMFGVTESLQRMKGFNYDEARAVAASFINKQRVQVRDAPGFPPWLISGARLPTQQEVAEWRDEGRGVRMGDHQEHFWDEDGRPALIVTHEYGNDFAQSIEAAARFGLQVSLGPSRSWYAATATLIVFRAPAVRGA